MRDERKEAGSPRLRTEEMLRAEASSALMDHELSFQPLAVLVME